MQNLGPFAKEFEANNGKLYRGLEGEVHRVKDVFGFFD